MSHDFQDLFTYNKWNQETMSRDKYYEKCTILRDFNNKIKKGMYFDIIRIDYRMEYLDFINNENEIIKQLSELIADLIFLKIRLYIKTEYAKITP